MKPGIVTSFLLGASAGAAAIMGVTGLGGVEAGGITLTKGAMIGIPLGLAIGWWIGDVLRAKGLVGPAGGSRAP